MVDVARATYGTDDDTVREMLIELERNERLLADADYVLSLAQAKYNLAASRYVAVRDSVVEYNNRRSPYDPDLKELWPPGATGPDSVWGKYQFLYEDPSDAVPHVLESASEPLSIAEILGRILAGGYAVRDNPRPAPIDGRTINAELMNLKDFVKKDAAGKYRLSYKDAPPP